MSVTAISADGVQHQFPDGTNPAVVDKVMKQYAASSGTFHDIATQIPVGLAQGVAGIVGLPGTIQSLTNRGLDYLTGQKTPQGDMSLPTAGDINAGIQKIGGAYPEPQTTAGKYARTISSFAPAALGGEMSLPARVATQVVAPGMASEAAGQATAGTPLEPYARAAGAVVGGLGAAALPGAVASATRSINRVSTAALGHGFLNPENQAGQQIARAISSGPGGAQGASARASQYGAVGASNPTAVDVGGNQTLRLVRAAAQASEGDAQDLAQSYADKVRSGLPDQMISRATALTPNRAPAGQVADQLAQQQSQQASTNYAQPYSQPATITPEAQSALQGPAGQAAIRRALVAAQARRDPQQTAELQALLQGDTQYGLPQVSTGTLHRVGIAMNERANLAQQQGARDIGSGLTARSGDIRQAIAQTPGMSAANAAYRASAADQDAVALGQGAYNMPSSDYASQLSDLASASANAQANAGIGYRQAITDQIGRQRAGATGTALTLATAPAQTAKLAATFGPKDAGDFQQALQLEVQRLRTANALPPNAGSQTALRGMDATNFLPMSRTGMLLLMARKLGAGITMSPAERAAIVRMGTDPDKVQQLVQQAAKIRQPSYIRAPAVAGAIGSQQGTSP